MKNLISLLFCLLTMVVSAQAEIHTDYSEPTLDEVQIINMKPTLMFSAPKSGATVWDANISHPDVMAPTSTGTLELSEGAPTFYNGGMNGRELNEQPSTQSYTLSSPAVSLKAGYTYSLLYTCAGSRKNTNKQLSVVLYRGQTPVCTIEQPYELQPMTSDFSWHDHTVGFSVEETGDDYKLVFNVEHLNAQIPAGLMLRCVSLCEAVPEGRGELTGYNLYLNNELAHSFDLSAVQQGPALCTYEADVTLDYSTEYSFALQAVYEGGESPLSNAVTKTTGADPNGGSIKFPVEGQAYQLQNYQAKFWDNLTLYLNLLQTEEHQRDAVLGEEPQAFFFVPTEGGYHVRTAEGYYLGSQLNKENTWNISALIPEVWTVVNYNETDGTQTYVLSCASGVLGCPEAAVKASYTGMYLTRDNKDQSYNGTWVITKTEGTYDPTYEYTVPEAVQSLSLSGTTAAPAYNLQGQRIHSNQRSIMIQQGKKVMH
ncbi:MAG: fibronectin type III domain-containing protein [Bacteroidaceae bacterium]|nr:fibronectin type III domain-containing protein [Bacteroidaceae bacterium]